MTVQKTKTRFENVSGRHIARGGALPVVNGCSRRHAVCCYSFPWCTLIEIRSMQPIRSIAGANASRYREGSGHYVLAARCNSRSSSMGTTYQSVRRFRAHTARCRALTCGSGFRGALGRVRVFARMVGYIHVLLLVRGKGGLCCSQDARDSNIAFDGITVGNGQSSRRSTLS